MSVLDPNFEAIVVMGDLYEGISVINPQTTMMNVDLEKLIKYSFETCAVEKYPGKFIEAIREELYKRFECSGIKVVTRTFTFMPGLEYHEVQDELGGELFTVLTTKKQDPT